MSKAAKIRELYAQGKSTREIADEVGCLPAYVRVAARQRRGGAFSKADTAYLCKRWNALTPTEALRKQALHRWRNDMRYRARRIARSVAYNKARYQADPEFRRRHSERMKSWRQRMRMRQNATAPEART